MPRPISDANPFCTARVKPGQVAFRLPDGMTWEQLVQRLGAAGWWGQIVGPHGSGKSTLLAGLCDALRQAGREVDRYSLAAGQRTLSPRDVDWNERTQVVVDGYEQLGGWQRWRLSRRVRRAGAGLLVTTHRERRMPVLFRMEADLETVQQLVDRLQTGFPPRITPQDVRELWPLHAPDVRELLFAIYDRYEQVGWKPDA